MQKKKEEEQMIHYAHVVSKNLGDRVSARRADGQGCGNPVVARVGQKVPFSALSSISVFAPDTDFDF